VTLGNATNIEFRHALGASEVKPPLRG
jgi:hypothetical protein